MTTTPTPVIELIQLCCRIELFIRKKQTANGFINTKLDLFSFTKYEIEEINYMLQALQTLDKECNLGVEQKKKLEIDLYIKKLILYLQSNI
jgi:hypothetical protein